MVAVPMMASFDSRNRGYLMMGIRLTFIVFLELLLGLHCLLLVLWYVFLLLYT